MNTTETKTIPIQPVPAVPAGDAEDEIGLYEIRKKIYPRSVTGTFANWRVALVIVTQVIYYGLPWLYWNDRQAVLFDLAARKFYIFGLVFWPQDVIYLTVLLILSAFSLFLFTAVAGRVWCGYACPQTVYTEIFLWIERKIEGERQARMRLDAMPRSLEKLVKKALKHTAWIALAVWTGYTFVGYFTPIRDLGVRAILWDLGGWETFWIVFYSLATYGNAGWMREQVCKYMCPYARFQSVMFDKDTLVIAYDRERGEPRGSRSKKIDAKAAGLGACIDCSICVQVCPTGIDIRKGLQYECIGCAACIDGCDQVMDKMGYPRGLIRYASENALHAARDRECHAAAHIPAAHAAVLGDTARGRHRRRRVAVSAQPAQDGRHTRSRRIGPRGQSGHHRERLQHPDHEHRREAPHVPPVGRGAAGTDDRGFSEDAGRGCRGDAAHAAADCRCRPTQPRRDRTGSKS